MWPTKSIRAAVEQPVRMLAQTVAVEAILTGGLLTLALAVNLPLAGSSRVTLVPGDLLLRAIRSGVPVIRAPRFRAPTTATATRGNIMPTHLHHFASRQVHRLTGTVLVPLALAVGLGAGIATAVPATAVAAVDQSAAATSVNVKTEIERADKALARATAQVKSRTYTKAIQSLTSARRHTINANEAAKGLIGAPPTDPESDDPPGPPAVMAALRLDYRVSTGAAALFDGNKGSALVQGLRTTVTAAQNRRDKVLDAVIALPAEGAGADYSDGMADTLGQYRREVEALSTALKTFTLSPSGTEGLTNALHRAQATQAKAQKAFGGGER